MQCYKASNSSFDKNGDIKLQPINAVLRMELNGICEIEFEHNFDKEGRWKKIEKLGVIKCPVCYSKNKQLFRIYDISKGLFSLKVQARHIFFDLIRHVILDNRAVNCNGQKALDIILKGTKFKGHSNIDLNTTAYFVSTNAIAAITGDSDNTFLNRWGGEISLDNFDIYINDKIGKLHNKKVKYSNNMLDLNLDENTDNIVTRVYPKAADGIMLPEKFIDSPNINKYPLIFEDYLEMNDLKLKNENSKDDDNSFETKEELFKEMRKRVQEYFDKGIDKPKLSGNVDIALLENTEEYKEFKNLVNISVGDILPVEHLDLNVNISTRCVGLEWDILTNKYNSITLGELYTGYFDKQDITREKLDNILNENGSVRAETLQGIVNAFTTKFKAQREIAEKQHVRAMLFEDLNPQSPTYGAMCLGSMGFEIANKRTKDGKDWAWSTFGSGQGFVADHIVAGVLSTILIQNLDGSLQIDLSGKDGALFKNFGKDAVRIHNNSIDLFNWQKNGDFIGSLTALTRIEDGKSDPDKPLIGLINDIDSALSIGYLTKEGESKSYIECDKYNILKNKIGKALRIFADIDFNNNNLYRAVIKSLNDKNFINVTDDQLSISFNNKYYLVLSDKGITLGQEGASLVISDGKIFLEGSIFDKNGNSISGSEGGEIGTSKASANIIYYIKGIEGFAPNIYKDSVGVTTLGYGMTGSELNGVSTPMSEESATKHLANNLNNSYYSKVLSILKSKGVTNFKQREVDAFTSFAYNLGVGAFAKSELLAKYVKGERGESIHKEFKEYVHAGGKVSNGLVRRREEEWKIFSGSSEKIRGYNCPPEIAIIGGRGVVTSNNGYGAKPY